MPSFRGYRPRGASTKALAVGGSVLVVAVLGVPTVQFAGAATSRSVASVVDINSNLAYLNAAAAGTGIVLTGNGLVLTNNHVIRGESALSVRDVGNGRTYAAIVLGYDVAADVALVQLRGAKGLVTAQIGNSASVKVGAKVVAIGNGNGTGGKPSSAAGRVTGLSRSILAADELAGTSEQLRGLIETNAAIVSGYSGGPLIDAKQQVIGVNTAGSSQFEFQNSAGRSYAVPINQAMKIATAIRQHKFTAAIHPGATAFLGVDLQVAGYFSNGAFHSGLLVVGVVPASPAERAGLSFGDVVTSFNGAALGSDGALTSALLRSKPGQTVSIAWVDQAGAAHSASVTLASGPPQ